jgi:protein Tex
MKNRLQRKKISTLVESYKIEAIAIGNGTASRETEHFIKTLRFPVDMKVFVVSEAGASIYSASKVARDEFPEYDVTVTRCCFDWPALNGSARRTGENRT